MKKISIDPKKTFTVVEYGKHLGVHRTTVYRWIKKGKIKVIEVRGCKLIVIEN